MKMSPGLTASPVGVNETNVCRVTGERDGRHNHDTKARKQTAVVETNHATRLQTPSQQHGCRCPDKTAHKLAKAIHYYFSRDRLKSVTVGK